MLFADPLAAAEMVAVSAVPTAAISAVKDAAAAPAGTVMPAGTATFVLLLARVTATPPVGAVLERLTEHGSASDPVMEVLLQEIAPMVGADFVAAPVPWRPTVATPALLETANWPVTRAAAEGLKRTVNANDSPGFNVTGKLPPVTEKPDPLTESDFSIREAVPLEVTTTDFETAVPTVTLPKSNAEALRLSPGVEVLDPLS